MIEYQIKDRGDHWIIKLDFIDQTSFDFIDKKSNISVFVFVVLKATYKLIKIPGLNAGGLTKEHIIHNRRKKLGIKTNREFFKHD